MRRQHPSACRSLLHAVNMLLGDFTSMKLTFPEFIDRRSGRLRSDIEQDADYVVSELDA